MAPFEDRYIQMEISSQPFGTPPPSPAHDNTTSDSLDPSLSCCSLVVIQSTLLQQDQHYIHPSDETQFSKNKNATNLLGHVLDGNCLESTLLSPYAASVNPHIYQAQEKHIGYCLAATSSSSWKEKIQDQSNIYVKTIDGNSTTDRSDVLSSSDSESNSAKSSTHPIKGDDVSDCLSATISESPSKDTSNRRIGLSTQYFEHSSRQRRPTTSCCPPIQFNPTSYEIPSLEEASYLMKPSSKSVPFFYTEKTDDLLQGSRSQQLAGLPSSIPPANYGSSQPPRGFVLNYERIQGWDNQGHSFIACVPMLLPVAQNQYNHYGSAVENKSSSECRTRSTAAMLGGEETFVLDSIRSSSVQTRQSSVDDTTEQFWSTMMSKPPIAYDGQNRKQESEEVSNQQHERRPPAKVLSVESYMDANPKRAYLKAKERLRASELSQRKARRIATGSQIRKRKTRNDLMHHDTVIPIACSMNHYSSLSTRHNARPGVASQCSDSQISECHQHFSSP